MTDWEEISLEHRDMVNEYLRSWPPEVSEHTFTNLYAWRDHRPILVGELQGCLVFLHDDDGERTVLGPQRGDASMVDLLDDLADAGAAGLKRIPAATANELRDEGFKVQEDRDNADYVYRREALAELPGNRYHRQQNLVNQCLSSYDCEWCEITPDILDEVAHLQDRWCDERDCGRKKGLCAEYNAIQETLRHYEEFELMGGAVRIDGQLEAYTVGERLNQRTAVVHFEKAMSAFTGLYQVVNQWFCQNCLGEFEFVNREQDLGIPGLRKAKKSYHPDHMVEKFTASLTGKAMAAPGQAAAGRCQE
ncbi:MAG: phosphatidylglycerol lysyltransferase domain-containing protein [Candidatus Brocadiia bacterium]